jgi:hypothetical protein
MRGEKSNTSFTLELFPFNPGKRFHFMQSSMKITHIFTIIGTKFYVLMFLFSICYKIIP